ncbi:hypothetical protein ACQP3F_29120, partial [Escherichia coli]
ASSLVVSSTLYGLWSCLKCALCQKKDENLISFLTCEYPDLFTLKVHFSLMYVSGILVKGMLESGEVAQ